LDESRLNIPESMRAWHFAGVRHFFNEITDDSIIQSQYHPSQWSAPWCDFFVKVPATAFLFFTYYDLGKDLAGQGSPDRRNFWRRFLPFFQLPKGSIAFWPLAIFTHSTYHEQIHDFFRTITYFSPSLVACFGNDCERSIKNFSSLKYSNLPQFLHVPHIEFLFQSTDEELSLLATQILSHVTNR